MSFYLLNQISPPFLNAFFSSSFKELGLPTPVSVCPTREIQASLRGRIMSPAFPEMYNNSLNCKLTMKIPPNKKTEITYDVFRVECTYSGILLLTYRYTDDHRYTNQYTHTPTCTCTPLRTFTSTYIFIYSHTYSRTYPYNYTDATCFLTRSSTRISTDTHLLLSTCTRIFTFICTFVRTYTSTHMYEY